MIVEQAPAKLNLALHVRRRRADGYHDIETLFAFCADGDVVRVEAAERDSFEIVGPFAALLRSPAKAGAQPPIQDSCGSTIGAPYRAWNSARGEKHDNLVTRAADAFASEFAITQPHAITLEKNLPIASGIGGGSADAAATLRALARLHDVALADPRLTKIAAALGADVPACLLGQTALGTGRGDALTPVDTLAGTAVLLVNPNVAVPTGAVFAAWDGVDRGPIGEGPLLARAKAGRNDLQPPALALVPIIADILALLDAPGVSLARMSGSGGTCFALFEDPAARAPLAAEARARGWWTLKTTLT